MPFAPRRPSSDVKLPSVEEYGVCQFFCVLGVV